MIAKWPSDQSPDTIVYKNNTHVTSGLLRF